MRTFHATNSRLVVVIYLLDYSDSISHCPRDTDAVRVAYAKQSGGSRLLSAMHVFWELERGFGVQNWRSDARCLRPNDIIAGQRKCIRFQHGGLSNPFDLISSHDLQTL